MELTSYIDDRQNIWFKGENVAKILGYVDTDDGLRRHVSDKYKERSPSELPSETLGYS